MKKQLLYLSLVVFFASCIACKKNDSGNSSTDSETVDSTETEDSTIEGVLPNIDLSNWKVTLPIGSPTEIEPPEILNYANITVLKDYMYNDTSDGSLVFFCEPGETTQNSSYSRTELREQMQPGSNSVNWTFPEGGTMSGKLKVESVSGEDNDKDRLIVMQIHGRLTNEQRDLIGEDDNNAPPVLKIYWDNGKIDVRRKVLKDLEVNDIDILKTDAWKDESTIFTEVVDYNEFEIDIEAAEGFLQVTLNKNEVVTYQDIHMEKWGIFENYFKAGNYLISTNSEAYSYVKYYELEVNH